MSAAGELERILRDLESIRDRVNAAIDELRPAVEPEEPETVNFTDEDLKRVLNFIRDVAPSAGKGQTQIWITRANIASELEYPTELVGRMVRRLINRNEIQWTSRYIAAAPLREARLRAGEGQVK